MAEISASVTAAPANASSGTDLRVLVPAGNAVTSLQADLAVAASASTGDTQERAEIALRFQPVADRTNLYTNAIYLRIELVTVPGGLIARRLFYECLNSACDTASSVGTRTAGDWTSSGVVVTQGTVYTASISWVPATKIVSYALSTGGNLIATATVDLLQASSGSPALMPPFDVSNESYLRTLLTAVVAGGAVGGGDGSIAAHFDNVVVGTNEGDPVLFDDFDGETVFDATKWFINGTGARIVFGK
jgi:hypothetical protein